MNQRRFISTGSFLSAVNSFQTLLFEFRTACESVADTSVTRSTRELVFASKAHNFDLLEQCLLLRSPGKQLRPGRQKNRRREKNMKKTVTAIVLVSVLAAPFAMVGSSFAAGGHQQRRVRLAAQTISTKTELEAEMRFRATGIKAEAEVEWEQGMRNGVLRTKLGGEVEIFLVNPATPPVAADIDAGITLNGGSCTFLNDPVVMGPFVVGTQTFYRVVFHGSVSQAGANPIVSRGLDCLLNIPAVAAGESASVNVIGLPAGTTTPILTGTFALDD